MFTFADLPLITASGVDPSLLRYVTWYLRHAAAYVADRGSVVYLIDTADMPDSEGLQTQAGAAGLGEYFRRVTSWTLGAGQPIDSLQGLSTDEINGFTQQAPQVQTNRPHHELAPSQASGLSDHRKVARHPDESIRGRTPFGGRNGSTTGH